MPKGRHPIPTKLKILKGTAEPRRILKDELTPDPSIPDPPVHLSDYAMKEWSRLAAELEELEYITELDAAILALYCQTYGRWREAEEELAVMGLISETPRGMPIQHPLVSIAHQEAEIMRKCAIELGFTPASRTRVAAKKPKAKKKENKFANL